MSSTYLKSISDITFFSHWLVLKLFLKWSVTVYNRQGFQREGTEQLFGTKGQKFLHCPGKMEKRDKLKILQRDGPGWDSQNTGRDMGQNGTEQNRMF